MRILNGKYFNSASKRNHIQLLERKIGEFHFKDPAEFLGDELADFPIFFHYASSNNIEDNLVEHDKTKNLKSEIYDEIIVRLRKDKIGETITKDINYQEVGLLYKDKKRRYLQIEYTTVRQTLITALFTTVVNKENIYLITKFYYLADVEYTEISSHIITSVILILLSWFLCSLFSYFLSNFPITHTEK